EPDKLKVWERGRKFIPKIMSFIQRYGTLSGQSIDVERMGRKGDTNTDYQLYPLQRDDKTTADLPEREQLAGKNRLVLDLTKDKMIQIHGQIMNQYKKENQKIQIYFKKEYPALCRVFYH